MPRTLNTEEQELSEKQAIIDELRRNLVEEQRAKARVNEELSQFRIAYTDLEERLQSELAQRRRMCGDKEKAEDDLERITEQQARTVADDQLNEASQIASTEREERFRNELVQMRRGLDGELRFRNSREQELRDKQKDLEELQRTLREEQQVRARVVEELIQARNTCTDLKERFKRDLAQMNRALDDEIHMRQTREQELNEAQKILGEEQKVRSRVEEELSQARIARTDMEERFQNDLKQMHEALEDEIRLRSAREKELNELQKTLGEGQPEETVANAALSQEKFPYPELEERKQGDIVQMRRTLDDKERTIHELHNALGEEQQARNRVDEELRQARIARTELEERLQNHLAQTRQKLSTREQEMRDIETVVFEFQIALGEEQQARTRVDEELSQAKSVYTELQHDLSQMRRTLDGEIRLRETREQELRNKEISLDELQRTLAEEQRTRTAVDEELSQTRIASTELEERLHNELAQMRNRLDDKERTIVDLQQTLVEEQQARVAVDEELSQARSICTELEERLHNDQLSSQSGQQELQNVIGEQRHRLEEEHQQRTALAERLSSLEPRMEEERNRNVYTDRELQSGVSTGEVVASEYPYLQVRRTRNTREKEMGDIELIVSKWQKALVEEQHARSRVDEELSQARCSYTELERDLAQMRRTFDGEIRLRNTREQELRDKEKKVQELQRSLVEEQQARTAVDEDLSQARRVYTELEERFQHSLISSQFHQQDLENTIRVQRHRLEEKRQQRTALEKRVSSLELRMEEERHRNLSAERELQSAVSASEEAAAVSRDWVIPRGEVVVSETILGRGGWAVVCEGTFRDCQVAVKQIHEVILSDHNRRLFEREMSIASRCRHPNLLQFIGATNDNGSPLLVSELLDTSLRQVLCQSWLKDDEIISLALDIAKGLNYLHLNKPAPILHRDISSANVLLWRRESSWRAKLADYGTVNFMQHNMTVGPGSMVYSAPEALTPQQSIKVDVYSFGVLLCEMCISELPDPQERRNQIGRVTGALRGLIQRCVKTNPEERPTMREVIRMLEGLRKQSGPGVLNSLSGDD